MESLSVAELAATVRPSESEGERSTLVRRIRHWTLAGALQPIGNVHGGTGKHRRYAVQEAYIAAILDVLADRSLPIGTLKAVASEVRAKPENQSALWQTAVSGVGSVFLHVVHKDPPDDAGSGFSFIDLVEANEVARLLQDKGMNCIIVVNVTNVFRDLQFTD